MTKRKNQMVEKMNEHWNFLETFIQDLIENDVLEGSQETGFPIKAMGLIEYGFRLAWPHAWKHGVQECLSRYEKKEQEDDEV